MENFFIGRQPILDRDKNLVAFELLFRSSNENLANVTHDLYATANVIVTAYGKLGIERILGKRRGFINVNAELLMSDAINLLPSKSVVLEILRHEALTSEVIARCCELKEIGYQFAIDNITKIDSEVETLLSIVNIAKVDVLALKEADLVELVGKLKSWPVLLLAEKVSDQQQAKRCAELGFEMFQGYYYAKPEIVSGKRADPAKLVLLNLLTLAMGDTDITDLEKAFKHQPSLSFNLLRMVNSAALNLPQKINSIKHAIMILGRRQLQRWIQLLLYAHEGTDANMSDALLQMAAVRGKMCEQIATSERPHDNNYQDRAFMVGILSLLDVVLGMEINEVVNQLNLSSDMKQALLQREGRLGASLLLVEADEKGEVETVKSIIAELGFLDMSKFTDIGLNALNWASKIGDTDEQ